MAFDLTKAAGLEKIVSNLDTMDVVQIPLDKLDPNEKNFFVVEDVQDLVESILVSGILQPLNVVRNGDRYRIIAGHRRFKAAGLAGLKEVPAIILPEMSDAMEWFMLIKTNTTTRELSHAEKAEAAIRMKKHLVQLKQEGHKIPGRLREIVAEQLEISRTELARMEVIDKKLIPAFKNQWKQSAMNASCAYELARLPDEDQEALLAKMDMEQIPQMTVAIVENYRFMKKVEPWVCDNCPYPSGLASTEQARRGEKVFCTNAEKILSHKEEGHPERCPGCCANCEDVLRCVGGCDNARSALARKTTQAREQEEREKREKAETERKDEETRILNASRLANIGLAVIPLIDKGGIPMESIAEWWTAIHSGMCPTYDLDDYDVEDVSMMLHPRCIEDADFSLTSFLSFCEAVDRTPNALLGYDDHPAGGPGGWHPYPNTCPDNGQKVIVFRRVMNMAFTGDFIYHDGEFYVNDDEFDPEYDAPANVPGVSAWIEFPEV